MDIGSPPLWCEHLGEVKPCGYREPGTRPAAGQDRANAVLTSQAGRPVRPGSSRREGWMPSSRTILRLWPRPFKITAVAGIVSVLLVLPFEDLETVHSVLDLPHRGVYQFISPGTERGRGAVEFK